ncbi:pseudouridine synthase [Maridesulfovibrio bastinii]|uniref:pseudouridine synthase n=1 Tax=Maridesulfovibrio bastinii TaxID=47157 RepID=UPI000411A5E0|nr:RluA family pseudouridine synthase [Maridesulfovibrio bastinii]
MPAIFVKVAREEAGQKLVRFLERRVNGGVPRSAIMRWIRKGDVRVDKGRKKPFDIVKEGQTVRIPPYRFSADEKEADIQTLEHLDIIFENDDILVVNKPGGLPVQGGSGHSDSVADRLKAMFSGKVFIPAPAHRLDRDTSGIVFCGKSHRGLKELSESFKNRNADKFYLAEVEGHWSKKGWTLMEDKMIKQGAPGKERMATGAGKTALAEVKSVKSSDRSLLIIKLLTGRTHQLRVQLAERGFPIVGDMKYGLKSKQNCMRLHCFKVRICGVEVSSLPLWIDSTDAELDLKV